MRRGGWIVLLAALAAVAGCIGTARDEVDTQSTQTPDTGAVEEVLAPPSEQALWSDPQLAPHPDFDQPTLTHVPEDAPEWWQPIDERELPDEVEGFEHLSQEGEGWAGDGFAIFGSLAVNPDGEIFDVSDPTSPEVLTTFDTGVNGRQSLIIPYTDGTLVTVIASSSGEYPVWDITDPEDPRLLSTIEVDAPGHTLANPPGTPYIYNANSEGGYPGYAYNPATEEGGKTEFIDLSDPRNPEVVGDWVNGYGCHAISFHMTEDKQRAYCAGVDATQIWDIEDPLDPQVVSTSPMPHNQQPAPGLPILATVSHWVVVNEDASVMAVADETGGGAAPVCDAHVDAGDARASGPFANVWFYDISDEENPELLSWISPSTHVTEEQRPGECTGHIGRMIPDADRDQLVMTFYTGGTMLIDFTNPEDPHIQDRWTGKDSMDSWYYNGYVFVGDRYDGIDVLALE